MTLFHYFLLGVAVEAGKLLLEEVVRPYLRKRRLGDQKRWCCGVHECGLWCVREDGHDGHHLDVRGHEWWNR